LSLSIVSTLVRGRTPFTKDDANISDCFQPNQWQSGVDHKQFSAWLLATHQGEVAFSGRGGVVWALVHAPPAGPPSACFSSFLVVISATCHEERWAHDDFRDCTKDAAGMPWQWRQNWRNHGLLKGMRGNGSPPGRSSLFTSGLDQSSPRWLADSRATQNQSCLTQSDSHVTQLTQVHQCVACTPSLCVPDCFFWLRIFLLLSLQVWCDTRGPGDTVLVN
jgi:hypothetical protein